MVVVVNTNCVIGKQVPETVLRGVVDVPCYIDVRINDVSLDFFLKLYPQFSQEISCTPELFGGATGLQFLQENLPRRLRILALDSLLLGHY